MAPPKTANETQTRKEIDGKLQAAGWIVQDLKCLDWYKYLYAAL